MALNIIFMLFLHIGFCYSYSEDFNDDLLKRIQAVEDGEKIQSLRLHSLEKQVKDYDKKYNFFQEENSILKRNLEVTSTKVRSMEMMIAHLKHDNDELKHNTEKEHALIVNLKEMVMQLHKTPETASSDINILADVHVPSEQRRPITNTWVDNKTDFHEELSSLQAPSNMEHGTVSLGQTNTTSKILPAKFSAQTYSQKSHVKRKPGDSRESRQQSDIVAFHAVLTPYNVPLGVNQGIIFDNTFLNIGNAYHTFHGLFTAPGAGIYLFSVSIAAYPSQLFWAELLKNGEVLARIIGPEIPTHSQGSVTIVTQLDSGDDIWVRHTHPDNSSIWGNKFTSFCGVLLTAL